MTKTKVDWPSLANDIKNISISASDLYSILNILQALKQLGMPAKLVKELETNLFKERSEEDVIEYLSPEAKQLRQLRNTKRMHSACRKVN